MKKVVSIREWQEPVCDKALTPSNKSCVKSLVNSSGQLKTFLYVSFLSTKEVHPSLIDLWYQSQQESLT